MSSNVDVVTSVLLAYANEHLGCTKDNLAQFICNQFKFFNIDKMLKTLSTGNTVFSFFFVGINLERQYVATCLVSIFDQTILNATRIQFHWAGRSSRGVTQLSGNLSPLFESGFTESIAIEQAKDFLQQLINMPSFSTIG